MPHCKLPKGKNRNILNAIILSFWMRWATRNTHHVDARVHRCCRIQVSRKSGRRSTNWRTLLAVLCRWVNWRHKAVSWLWWVVCLLSSITLITFFLHRLCLLVYSPLNLSISLFVYFYNNVIRRILVELKENCKCLKEKN